ncbi:MAG: prolyl oligopeptidase family serine peptidase [Cyclobacteriaceae bacterium]|nr:prolyl oligopeptidase family serine peptidase [Cyclobacteriaceae bacterium]
MKKLLLYIPVYMLLSSFAIGQSQLTIPQIMEGTKFVGNSPNAIYWDEHGEYLYFNWNPENNLGDSLYRISMEDHSPIMVSAKELSKLPSKQGNYTKDKTKKTYTKNGDLYLYNLTTRVEQQVTNTIQRESSPIFSSDQQKIFYSLSGNLYAWEIKSGITTQLTDFKKGNKKIEAKSEDYTTWIKKEEMELIKTLQEREEKRNLQIKNNKSNDPSRAKTIYTGKASVSTIQISPDENFITYSLFERPANSNRTNVPNYVTESGYIETLNSRPKVGSPTSKMNVGIYDIQNDTTYRVSTSDLPNIDLRPDFVLDKNKKREVYVHAPLWSDEGGNVILIVRSKDNKDRWICLLDIKTGILESLDHQHDDAWIGGPGIGWSQWDKTIGWIDSQSIWFQSEETGYSHLYTINIKTGKKQALTKGKFEIYNPRISDDKLSWYFESNMQHPGERYVYKMDIKGGKFIQLTSTLGRSDAYFSPDNKKIALRYSNSMQPWELYLMDNQEGTKPKRITTSTTSDFDKYNWRSPEHITFKAKDGANVHARLYKPEKAVQNGPAIIFVHGAGYLQNAHKWWSSYYREYMFHNYLVDNGYTVLDIDYRASAGYGRDWRTGIYQHMGGLDLSDQIDGANYLVNMHNINAKKIGIYGGSYGGFITLMAMFTAPDVFAAGAALRSVTDWAHYNHGYTSNILNTPIEDPEAYRKSSPIYYAEGLKGALLMCHGMIDTNVQFQDIVRLSQRLIELKKENWELAVYPLEGHGFVEPSSWTDEYSRIFKLFEDNLK